MNTDNSGFDFEMITLDDPTELEVREVSLHCFCCGCGYVDDE
ncbi:MULTISPECIES: hypothetical protein [Sorangium]|uniref:Uncharacterized protein n=1 Tax=Sorangium cellulosum TaxID=56 RepID=A0A4P2QIL6_SORCE|nr:MULTISPECIES: hypothetical protein [Sorangium]AUX29847.1 uncharacterized protein SOCE836_019400 [Sorangium cellulosum]WCQ89235.1 hypothetical protein NQZ70_01922 [Sorangium sp. Soce836]